MEAAAHGMMLEFSWYRASGALRRLRAGLASCILHALRHHH
jgi:hypothetical protein